MKNKYFIMRHGQTIHQTEKKGITYRWPDDNPPCNLTEHGRQRVKAAAKKLKNKGIDLIISSDILRTRQTAAIVAQELGLKVKHDKRLRDVNWGIYQGQHQTKAYKYYSAMEEKFTKAPPKGESWGDIQKRVADLLKEVEKKYKDKTILIVSHGDPLWLLQGWVKGLGVEELVRQKKGNLVIKTSEIRQL